MAMFVMGFGLLAFVAATEGRDGLSFALSAAAVALLLSVAGP